MTYIDLLQMRSLPIEIITMGRVVEDMLKVQKSPHLNLDFFLLFMATLWFRNEQQSYSMLFIYFFSWLQQLSLIVLPIANLGTIIVPI